MERFGHIISTCVLFVIITVTIADNPGVKMRVTQNGIAYASTVAETFIRQALGEQKINDLSGKEGSFEWSVTSIQVQSITGPNVQISLNPANGGLTLSFTNFGVRLHGDWRAKKRVVFMIRGSGSVDLDVSGVSLTVTVGLGSSNGRPSFSSRNCVSSIGNLGIDIHGGLVAAVLRLFRGRLENKLKDSLQELICKTVNKQIDSNANNELAKLKVLLDIDRFGLDYSLVAAPVITSTYLEVQSKGEFYLRNGRTVSSLTSAEIVTGNDVNSMLYVWLNEYVTNTLAQVAHNAGLFRYNLKLNNLLGGLTDTLRITSQVGALYPNSDVELRISTTAAPTVKIDNNTITVSALGDLNVVANAQNVITANIRLSVTVQPFIRNEKLIATIVEHSFEFSISSTAIPDIDRNELNVLLNEALDDFVIPGLNIYGDAGIELPVTGIVKFYNTNLRLQRGVMLVSSDVRYG
uniref:Lipid-binding serum glycoprotein N-terminal domain-containing protein n=1 Tax=Arion vulgaris TaxID=1028688 RepID=A0A0B7BC01_9EUPU